MVPWWATWPFETLLVPLRHVQRLPGNEFVVSFMNETENRIGLVEKLSFCVVEDVHFSVFPNFVVHFLIIDCIFYK